MSTHTPGPELITCTCYGGADDGEGHPYIVFCPLHAAAPELYEALMACITDDGACCFVRPQNNADAAMLTRRRLLAINDCARAALAKAEEKGD